MVFLLFPHIYVGYSSTDILIIDNNYLICFISNKIRKNRFKIRDIKMKKNIINEIFEKHEYIIDLLNAISV